MHFLGFITLNKSLPVEAPPLEAKKTISVEETTFEGQPTI
jgi:hypothetical protein